MKTKKTIDSCNSLLKIFNIKNKQFETNTILEDQNIRAKQGKLLNIDR